MSEIKNNVFKRMPSFFKIAINQFKAQWLWFIIPFAVSLIMLGIMMLVFNLNQTDEVKQANGYFRLAGIFSFAMIIITIYKNYTSFKKHYYVNKLFNINPIYYFVVVSAITSILMLIAVTAIALVMPVNLEHSFLSLLYYVIMSFIFMVVASTIFGLLTVIRKNVKFLFIIITVISFLMVPTININDIIT